MDYNYLFHLRWMFVVRNELVLYIGIIASLIPSFGCQTRGENFVALGNVTVGLWTFKFSSFWNFSL
jgi:hypothetical protein